MVPFVVGSTLMRNSRNFGALVARERSATNRAVRRAPGLKNKGERGRLRRRSFDRVEPMLDNDLFVKDFFSLFILLSVFPAQREKNRSGVLLSLQSTSWPNTARPYFRPRQTKPGPEREGKNREFLLSQSVWRERAPKKVPPFLHPPLALAVLLPRAKGRGGGEVDCKRQKKGGTCEMVPG